MLLLTDDKLIDTMRAFVTATNRVQHLSSGTDLASLERATVDHRDAARALQQALLERGWRQPGQ